MEVPSLLCLQTITEMEGYQQSLANLISVSWNDKKKHQQNQKIVTFVFSISLIFCLFFLL